MLDLDKPVAFLPPHYRGPQYDANDSAIRTPQWWTLQYGIDKARENGITGAGVIIVVCDTGVDAGHPDLSGRVVGEVDGTGEPGYENSHGTHCAGIIAANWDGSGIGGVAAGAKIISAKGLRSNGSGSSNSLATALRRGIEAAKKLNPISIITSNSWGGRGRVQQVEEVFAANPDVLNVAAAGNDGTNDGIDHPAAGNFALAIGAHDEQRRLASFSDRGPQLDFVAPGVQILSTVPGGGYQRMSGTSMATPWAAAAIALLHEAEYKAFGAVRTKTIPEVIAKLRVCCDDGGPDGRDNGYGFGFINMQKWLAVEDIPPPPSSRWQVKSSTFELLVYSPDQPAIVRA